MEKAEKSKTKVLEKVKTAIKGRTIVGYNLKHDLKALEDIGLVKDNSANWLDLLEFYDDIGLKERVGQLTIILTFTETLEVG